MAIPAGVELKCWSYQPSQMKQLRSSSKNMHFKQGLLGREMFKPADRRWTLILMILNLISVLLWTIDDPYSGFQSWTMKTYFLGQRFALTLRKSARRSRTRFGLTCMIFWFRTYWKDICLKIGYPQFQWSIIIIPFIYIHICIHTYKQGDTGYCISCSPIYDEITNIRHFFHCLAVESALEELWHSYEEMGTALAHAVMQVATIEASLSMLK